MSTHDISTTTHHGPALTRAMKHLQLIRSWSKQSINVAVDLYQSPLVLYDQSDVVEQDAARRWGHVGAGITVTSDQERNIGGVSLIRQVLLRRKIPKTKNWTDWEEVQRSEIQVVGECTVCGQHKFDCYLPIPGRLPETRTTHYDQLVHLITVIVHDLSPLYTAVKADPTGDNEEQTRRAKNTGVLVLCHKSMEVVHCPSLRGDIPVLECEQMVRLSDSGKVTVKAASQLFVLGSHIDIGLDFHNLTPDTTVHAISATLIQETHTPLKTTLPDLDNYPSTMTPHETNNENFETNETTRSRYTRRRRPVLSRISSMWASIKEKPPIPQSSVIDEFSLLSEGVADVISSESGVPHPHSVLWRGEAGRILDARSPHGATSSTNTSNALTITTSDPSSIYLDDAKASAGALEGEATERTTSRLRLHRRARLPSNINGAHHSTNTLVPVLAKVTHCLVIDIIYSVLGQDELGKALIRVDGAQPEEGLMRRATTKFEVDLPACTLIPESVQPPSYVTSSSHSRGRAATTTGDVPHERSSSRSPPSPGRRFSTLSDTFSTHSDPTTGLPLRFASSQVAHSRAFRASNGKVIAPKRVFYSDHDVRTAVQRHQKEKGYCACAMC